MLTLFVVFSRLCIIAVGCASIYYEWDLLGLTILMGVSGGELIGVLGCVLYNKENSDIIKGDKGIHF